jgi:hypothetical protein
MVGEARDGHSRHWLEQRVGPVGRRLGVQPPTAAGVDVRPIPQFNHRLPLQRDERRLQLQCGLLEVDGHLCHGPGRPIGWIQLYPTHYNFVAMPNVRKISCMAMGRSQ